MEQERHEKVLTLQEEVISRAIATMRKACQKAEKLCNDYRPLLGGERLLTDAEVAAFLKVSRRTLQEYRNDGIMPYIEMKGKCVYRESDVEKVLKAHERKTFRMS